MRVYIYICDICNKYADNSFKYSKSVQLILFHWRHTETRAAGSLDKAWMTGDLGSPISSGKTRLENHFDDKHLYGKQVGIKQGG